MPFRRRRIKRVTMGKDPIKHSQTAVSTIGGGSIPGDTILIKTTVGNRSLDGSTDAIQSQANTAINVMVSTIVKYLHLTIKAAVTEEGQTAQNDTQGWIEWAIVFREEVAIPIPSTNTGINTLGDIATKMFRGDCLMTGSFPVSVNLPNQTQIQLKLPKKAVKWRMGAELTLYTLFRSSNVTDLETNSVRLIQDWGFKAYN